MAASRIEFNDLLVDSVTEAISDVLGAKVNDAFWHHYRTHLGIAREEMPYRLDTLFAELKSAFGIGGETLGRLIVKRLYAKTETPLKYVPGRPFAEYVEALKDILAEDLMQPQQATKRK